MATELRKIVVVDDVNFHLLNFIERLKKHYEIYPAQSAEILFEILENITPDLILLDINMPEVDGFKILEKLKTDSPYADIPVIFLTGKTKRQNAIKAIQLGAVDFLTKPFTDEHVIESIEYQLDPEKRRANKPIILAVDDSPIILQEVNYELQEFYTVYTLPDPEKLKDLLKIITPDLFILDYKMPKLSGFELVPIIRDFHAHAETPIIFLTTEGTIDHISTAINLGAFDFMVKPIDPDVLHTKVGASLKDYIIRRRIRTLDKRWD